MLGEQLGRKMLDMIKTPTKSKKTTHKFANKFLAPVSISEKKLKPHFNGFNLNR